MAVGDYVLSGLGGAASGAATGAAGGVPGAIVGGVVGAGMALFGQAQADKQEKEAEKLLAKQRRRQKDLTAKSRSIERRALAQQTEAGARGVKEGMTIPSPKVSSDDVTLLASMAAGTGSPFDNYILRTYGRPQSSDVPT
jgi:hypothetical protein